MAKHLSKMDDGHFIIENEDEYNKRTGEKEKVGCFGLFLVAIILSIQALCCDDDKTKSPSKDKTETATTKQEPATPKTYQNVKNISKFKK